MNESLPPAIFIKLQFLLNYSHTFLRFVPFVVIIISTIRRSLHNQSAWLTPLAEEQQQQHEKMEELNLIPLS